MAAGPMSQIELTVSCKNLRDRDLTSKSDPICVLFMKGFGGVGQFEEVGRTERIENCHDPVFTHRFPLDYYFEESQKLKFEIYDIDSSSAKLQAHDFLGRLECTLGEIIGAQGSKIHKQLKDQKSAAGSIIVCAEEIGSDKRVVTMQWAATKLDNKDTFGKSDPFFQIFRINDDMTRTVVYRSEMIKNNLNPVWRPFKIPFRLLANGTDERRLSVEVYDYDSDGGHDLIGLMDIRVRDLMQAAPSPNKPSNEYPVINPKKATKSKYKNSGKMRMMQFNIAIEHSFLDYVRGGTQVHFTVAVDFTASNGNPVQPNSLHYIHPHIPNQYQIALKAVGEICQDYDTDKLFPALGFGAKLANGTVSHEFFLNQHPNDPHCFGVEGILDAYRRSIMSVTLYGPTNFSPVINHVAKFASASSRDGSHYFVLLIITDGVITDFDKTKMAIVNASSLPMSIIIVGVGNDPFNAMDELDSDKGALEVNGRRAERDIVQFVPFRKYLRPDGNFALSQAQLAKDVLKEIPKQLTSWMLVRKIEPRPPIHVDMANLQIQHDQPQPQAPDQHSPLPPQPQNQQYYPNAPSNPQFSQAQHPSINPYSNAYAHQQNQQFYPAGQDPASQGHMYPANPGYPAQFQQSNAPPGPGYPMGHQYQPYPSQPQYGPGDPGQAYPPAPQQPAANAAYSVQGQQRPANQNQ